MDSNSYPGGGDEGRGGVTFTLKIENFSLARGRLFGDVEKKTLKKNKIRRILSTLSDLPFGR